MYNLWMLINAIFVNSCYILCWFFGGFDEKICTLFIMFIVEFIVLILTSIHSKKRFSNINYFNFYSTKVSISITVGIAHLVDSQILGNCDILRSTALIFYITYEGIIILNKISQLIPIPQKLKKILKILCEKQLEDEE